MDASNLHVYMDGTISWVPRMTYKVPCQVDEKDKNKIVIYFLFFYFITFFVVVFFFRIVLLLLAVGHTMQLKLP